MPPALASTMYFFVVSSPEMSGVVRPARGATSVKVTGKGWPENFGRGAARTPRVAMPCAPRRKGLAKRTPAEPRALRKFRRVADLMKMAVRSTLECGGSTPPWHHTREGDQGGVEPPHSKVLRT